MLDAETTALLLTQRRGIILGAYHLILRMEEVQIRKYDAYT
jgi:hypothetical protein